MRLHLVAAAAAAAFFSFICFFVLFGILPKQMLSLYGRMLD